MEGGGGVGGSNKKSNNSPPIPPTSPPKHPHLAQHARFLQDLVLAAEDMAREPMEGRTHRASASNVNNHDLPLIAPWREVAVEAFDEYMLADDRLAIVLARTQDRETVAVWSVIKVLARGLTKLVFHADFYEALRFERGMHYNLRPVRGVHVHVGGRRVAIFFFRRAEVLPQERELTRDQVDVLNRAFCSAAAVLRRNLRGGRADAQAAREAALRAAEGDLAAQMVADHGPPAALPAPAARAPAPPAPAAPAAARLQCTRCNVQDANVVFVHAADGHHCICRCIDCSIVAADEQGGAVERCPQCDVPVSDMHPIW